MTTKKTTARRMKVVRALDEIPPFSSEDEERDWWAAHDLSEELYDRLTPPTKGEAPARDGLVRVVVDGPPPVYGAALSIFSPKHPHARRVTTLRRAAEQAMQGRRPLHQPVVLVVSQVYTEHAMADAANILGAVSNALEGIVYANDGLIREAYFRSRRGTRSSYTVVVRPFR